MRATLCLAFLAAALTLDAAPNASACSVSPAILETLRNPVAATDEQWTATRKALDRIVFAPACAEGPRDAASRRRLFQILEAEMTLDYPALLKEWARRDGKRVSEGVSEGVMYFQRDFLAYIDKIVTAQDVAHKDLILKYAKGEAIAKLGRAVKDDVKKQAGTAVTAIYGVEAQTQQEEAFRAIGYWLVPADTALTPAEKRELAIFLAGALPPDGAVRVGAHNRAVRTIVNALGNSDLPEIEEKLRAWRHVYENKNGRGHTLARLAQEAADSIRAKASKK